MKIPKMLWVISLLLFLATALNYADRMVLSIVSVDIRNEFRFLAAGLLADHRAVLLAYSIMYAGSGWIIDRLGTKRGFGLFILCWSFSQVLHAFAFGKWSLAGYRFMLGLSEPGNWPAAAKAVGEWFPPAQRALGVGLFNAGSSIGSVIAPPLVAWITVQYGWRSAFVVTGLMGFAWLAAWMLSVRSAASESLDHASGIRRTRSATAARRRVCPHPGKDRCGPGVPHARLLEPRRSAFLQRPGHLFHDVLAPRILARGT